MTQPIYDNQTFQVGGAIQPIGADSTPLLLRADPTIFYALDYFAWIIRTYPGPGLLLAAISGAGLKSTDGTPVSDPVAQAYPEDPVPYLTSTYLRFPVLGLYRKDAKYNKHSAGYYDNRCTFDLIYVLPPMTAGQAEGILPILHAVESAISRKTVQSYDPSYMPPNGVLGDSPWGLKYAAVEEIGFTAGSRGKLPGTGNLEFPYLVMNGFVIERDMPLPAQNKFAGGDITVNLIAPDGTTIETLAQVSTQGPPTATSISPASGTHLGGTSLTLLGTLFLNGAQIYIGTQLATSIVVASPTTITCDTPVAGGSGTVDVTIINADGQQVVMPQAFSFT